MTKFLSFILSIFTLVISGQVDRDRTFKKSDYQTTKYLIKADTFDFNGFKIELIHVKLKDNKTFDSTAVYCRIWLTVKKDNSTIDKLFINDCEALGGCSGIYVSKEQKSKDYFILSKFGDYNGRILLIDKLGKIKSYIGGHYYLSTDNKYLFSTYDSDLSGLTVYDLSKNYVLFTSDTIRTYLADFYYSDSKYFAIVSEDVKKVNQTKIATYDFKTNKLILSTVDDNYILKAKQLKTYNINLGPCNCGQTEW